MTCSIVGCCSTLSYASAATRSIADCCSIAAAAACALLLNAAPHYLLLKTDELSAFSASFAHPSSFSIFGKTVLHHLLLPAQLLTASLFHLLYMLLPAPLLIAAVHHLLLLAPLLAASLIIPFVAACSVADCLHSVMLYWYIIIHYTRSLCSAPQSLLVSPLYPYLLVLLFLAGF